MDKKGTIEEPFYSINIDENTEPTITKGNMKIGKGIYSFSLLPGDTPIEVSTKGVLTNISGTCSGVCKDCKQNCYAIRDAKLYNRSTVPAWAKNTLLARTKMNYLMQKIDTFIKTNDVKEFRWHVAGEIESYEYLIEMNKIALNNSKVKFGVYTKRFDLVDRFLKENGNFAKNFCVNISEWNHNTDGYDFSKLNKFVWDDGTDETLKNVTHCPAVSKPATEGGKGHETGVTCDTCGRCYRTTGKITAVYNH